MARLEEILSDCDNAYRRNPSADTSVYTGSAGLALLHLHLATTLYHDNQMKSRRHLQLAHEFLSPCLSRLPSRQVTFLCGAGGPLAIAAVVEAGLGRPDRAKVSEVSRPLLRPGPVAPTQELVDQLKQLYTERRTHSHSSQVSCCMDMWATSTAYCSPMPTSLEPLRESY